jgi:hypothetical protein
MGAIYIKGLQMDDRQSESVAFRASNPFREGGSKNRSDVEGEFR